MKTGWGPLPVVSIEDLIALKKTRRLYDYEVISNLVRIRVEEARVVSRERLRWSARETFRPEDRVEFARRSGKRLPLNSVRRRIALEVARSQGRDVAYWRPIIRELRDLRRRGLLLPVGSPVKALKSSVE